MIEFDPKYVDVIVKRWQEFTGKQAVLDSDGRTFDELAEERLSEVGGARVSHHAVKHNRT